MRYRYGSPDVVEVREVETPTPSEGQVLVRVRAASVNRADLDGIRPRPGFVRLFLGLRAPRDPRVGTDVAGVVESVGPDASRFQPGDEVFADLAAHGQGSFAEYVCASEEAFEPMPSGMSFEEASTVPHSAVLALQGLRTRKGRTLRPGDRLLVIGASGNVGPFAVQIGKSLGAHVTGVASAGKLDLVRSVGADAVIDYRSVRLPRSRERWDWILDTDSHYSVVAMRRLLRPNGVYVTLGGEGGAIFQAMLLGGLLSLFGNRWSGMMLWWKPMHRPDIDRIRQLIAEGTLRPVIERFFPLDEVVAALRHVNDGLARGKVVIRV